MPINNGELLIIQPFRVLWMILGVLAVTLMFQHGGVEADTSLDNSLTHVIRADVDRDPGVTEDQGRDT